MEDCCAVCAEPLEWIGYGPCGHLDVCFKCIARLRFVLNDKHCCICKQYCPEVFVTKALGDYTRVVTDWNSLLNLSHNSGQGRLYFEHAVEAYFDDEEPFKIVEAMCRLHCSICEVAGGGESVTNGMVKKGYTFRILDNLRRHHTNVHKVFMCRLCLEGRKVFICEQKLYGRGGHVHTSTTNDDQLTATVHASGESSNLETAIREALVISPNADESTLMTAQGDVERLNVGVREEDFPPLQAQGDAGIQRSRYLVAVWGARPSAPHDAALPPLSGASRRDAAFPALPGASRSNESQSPSSIAALFNRNGSEGRATAGIRILNVADHRLSVKKDEAGPAHLRSAVSNTDPLPVAIPAQTGWGISNIRAGLQVREMGVEEIREANKALIQGIRAGLRGNEQKFADFKDVSSLFQKER